MKVNITLVYSIYTALSAVATIWVGRTLYIQNISGGWLSWNVQMADPVNHLLDLS